MDPEQQSALHSALQFLESRDRFASQVRQKLEAEGHSEEIVAFVIGHLRQKGILNDNRTAQAIVERNSGRRAKGSESLRSEMERAGAPAEVIEIQLASMSEIERAMVALRAKYKSGADRGKAGRFLFSRGFGEEAVESALDAFCPSLD